MSRPTSGIDVSADARPRPLRVLLVVDHLDLAGGVERFACRLADALAARGMSVVLGSVDTTRDRLAFAVDEAVRVVAARAPQRRSIDVGRGLAKIGRVLQQQWRRGRALSRLIAAEQPDVTVLNGLVTAVSTLAFDRRIAARAIVCDHNHFDARSKPWRWLRARLYPRVAAVVSLTEADAPRFRALNANTVVIGNVSPLQADAPPAAPDPWLVLAAGRHVAQKGFDLLLRAWQTVAAKVPEARLRIVGDGPLRDELHALARDLGIEGRVEWIERSAAMAEHYGQATVFVLPSRYEGMPLALLEAQALGVPSVAFDCPTGPRDILSADTGVLVPPLDVDALAAAITALLLDPARRHRLAQAAIVRNRERFDPVQHADRWAALIGEVGSRSRRGKAFAMAERHG